MNIGRGFRSFNLTSRVFYTPVRSVKAAFPMGPRIPPKPYIHPLTIRRKLNADPETVLKILEIDVNEELSNDEQIRVGSRGSLSINREVRKGCPVGIWYNFETDESGDMFELVKIKKNLKTHEMLKYAVENILPSLEGDPRKTVCGRDITEDEKDREDKRNRIIGISRRIMSELLPIDGTIAEDYLRQHRRIGLTQINDETLKFHPNLVTKATSGEFLYNLPGLVAIASHPSSDRSNMQVTYLDPATGKKHPGVALAKRTFGSFSDTDGHHYCEISRTLGYEYTFIAEGVETALSVNEAFQEEHVIATLGKNNFIRIDPRVLNEKVVLVFDNDGKDIWDDKILLRATERLIVEGKEVYIVFPPAIEGLDKTDMNDFLVHLGVEGVHKVIMNNMKKVKL